VADASARELDHQVQAVRSVLGEIGAGPLPEVVALNKVDLLDTEERSRVERRYPDAVPISGLTGEGLEQLLHRIAETIPAPPVEVTLLVPFDREDLVALLYRDGEVLTRDATEQGSLIRARVPERHLSWAKDLLTRPVRLPVRSE